MLQRVPVLTSGLGALLQAYNKTLSGNAPVLVHCSAGIGRTGTYIGLDICTKMLQLKSKIDATKVVDIMRNDRGGLVQHQAQLAFLHECIKEFAKRWAHFGILYVFLLALSVVCAVCSYPDLGLP